MQVRSLILFIGFISITLAFAFNEDRPQAFAFNGARGSELAGRMFAIVQPKNKRADPQRFAFAEGNPSEAAKFAFAFAKRGGGNFSEKGENLEIFEMIRHHLSNDLLDPKDSPLKMRDLNDLRKELLQ